MSNCFTSFSSDCSRHYRQTVSWGDLPF